MPFKNKEQYNEYSRKYQANRYKVRRAAFIEELGGSCKKCGATENLEFDHIDSSTKSFDISKALGSRSYEKLAEEIKKCQLLCGICHLEKSRENKDLGNVSHGGGKSGKRNCPCAPCKAKKAEYMKSKKDQYQAARDAKRKANRSKVK